MLNLGPCSMLPPHFHPRAANYVVATQGNTTTYMWEENGARLVTEILTPGKGTIFPKASMHMMVNNGKSHLHRHSHKSTRIHTRALVYGVQLTFFPHSCPPLAPLHPHMTPAPYTPTNLGPQAARTPSSSRRSTATTAAPPTLARSSPTASPRTWSTRPLAPTSPAPPPWTAWCPSARARIGAPRHASNAAVCGARLTRRGEKQRGERGYVGWGRGKRYTGLICKGKRGWGGEGREREREGT